MSTPETTPVEATQADRERLVERLKHRALARRSLRRMTASDRYDAELDEAAAAMIQAFANRPTERALDDAAVEAACKAHCDYFGGEGWWDGGFFDGAKGEAIEAMRSALEALKAHGETVG